jgi:hypothetical protein
VEILTPEEQAKHHHAWLEWIGLEEPPPEPDSWVPVVRGLTLDHPRTGSSTLGSRLVDELAAAKIEAHQRLYEFYNVTPGSLLPRSGEVSAVAVVVHNRDLAAAGPVAAALADVLEHEPPPAVEPESGLSDDELTRIALEAGPPPPD